MYLHISITFYKWWISNTSNTRSELVQVPFSAVGARSNQINHHNNITLPCHVFPGLFLDCIHWPYIAACIGEAIAAWIELTVEDQ